MAELVDALDSKSCSLCEWEFKSPHPYQKIKTPARVFFLYQDKMQAEEKKYLNQRASNLYNNGDYQKSSELSLQVLAEDPKNYTALINLGNVSFLQKKYKEAILYYNRARHIKPQDPIALTNMGLVCYERSKFSKSKIFLQKVLKKDSHNQNALTIIGQIYLEEEKYSKAIRSFKTALKFFPQDVWLHSYLGRSLQKSKKFSKALDEMWQALELSNGADSQHLDLAYGLYEIAIEKGKKFVDPWLKKWQKKYPQNDIVIQTWNAFYPDKNFTVSKSGYISNLFDVFADNFEDCLQALDYHAPEFIAQKSAKFCQTDSNKKLRILDLGCGTGLCGKYLDSVFKNKEFIGVDLSSKMLAKAKEKNIYNQLIRDDLLHYLKINTKLFDLVVSADVFTYFGNLDKTFFLINKSLHQNGIFIFTISKNIISKDDWIQHLSGRFLHSEKYIKFILQKYKFLILDFEENCLRYEGEKEVLGWIVTVMKK